MVFRRGDAAGLSVSDRGEGHLIDSLAVLRREERTARRGRVLLHLLGRLRTRDRHRDSRVAQDEPQGELSQGLVLPLQRAKLVYLAQAVLEPLLLWPAVPDIALGEGGVGRELPGEQPHLER